MYPDVHGCSGIRPSTENNDEPFANTFSQTLSRTTLQTLFLCLFDNSSQQFSLQPAICDTLVEQT